VSLCYCFKLATLLQADDADTYLQGARQNGVSAYERHKDELAKLAQLQPGQILQQGQPPLTRRLINTEKAKHDTLQREVTGETCKNWPIEFITEVCWFVCPASAHAH
jgi:hypothetical protein